jgi:hypothetical protein
MVGRLISGGRGILLLAAGALLLFAVSCKNQIIEDAMAVVADAHPIGALTFTPDGEVSSTAITVAIACDTDGATIVYTTDGSAPSKTHGTVYSGPISVASVTTIKAFAYKDLMKDAPVKASTYYIGKLPPPTFSVAAGSYDSEQTVTITCPAFPTADIRYLFDQNGTSPSITAEPQSNSPLQYSGGLKVNTTRAYKARCFDPAGLITASDSVMVIYHIVPTAASAPVPGDTITGVDYDLTSLSWTAASDAGGAVTYDVYFDTTGALTTPQSSSQSGTTWSLPTLSPATTYYWRIDSINVQGEKSVGPVWSFTTADLPLGPTPTVAKVQYNTIAPLYYWDTRLDVSWTPGANVDIYQSTDGVTWGSAIATSQSSGSYTATGLSGGTLYYFVTKQNNLGVHSRISHYSVATSQRTAPSAPAISGQSHPARAHLYDPELHTWRYYTEPTLTWSAPTGAASYNVYGNFASYMELGTARFNITGTTVTWDDYPEWTGSQYFSVCAIGSDGAMGQPSISYTIIYP